MSDYGLHYWRSHHSCWIPQPFRLEPTGSYSKREIDEYLAVLDQVATEARENPELVRSAPHNQTLHSIDHKDLDDAACWANTWRSHRWKYFSGVDAEVAAEFVPVG